LNGPILKTIDFNNDHIKAFYDQLVIVIKVVLQFPGLLNCKM
jgi:hypothetical protein